MKEEFYKIISNVIKSEKFMELKNESHHGINRMEHSIKVAKLSFFIAKKFNMDSYKKITRAAILHDYFLKSDLNGAHALNHPRISAQNALKDFNLDKKEYNAIESHMFPLSFVFPKYKESVVVNIADKLVALYEVFRYKVPLKSGTMFLFLINFTLK